MLIDTNNTNVSKNENETFTGSYPSYETYLSKHQNNNDRYYSPLLYTKIDFPSTSNGYMNNSKDKSFSYLKSKDKILCSEEFSWTNK